MQVGKEIPRNQVLFNLRHSVTTNVLQMTNSELDRVPPAVNISPKAIGLGQTKLKLSVGTIRSNQAEITLMENEIAGGIRTTRELDGEPVVQIEPGRKLPPGCHRIPRQDRKLSIKRIDPGA